MQRNDLLTPPVQYNIIWLIAGSVLLLAVLALNFFILWSTRKKKIKSVATLPVLPPVQISIEELRKKYLGMITAIEFQYHNEEISLRQLHLLLSTTVRLFVFEVKGVAVHKLTLTEIKKIDLKALSDVIENYYPPEFERIENGKADNAISLARRMVQQWS